MLFEQKLSRDEVNAALEAIDFHRQIWRIAREGDQLWQQVIRNNPEVARYATISSVAGVYNNVICAKVQAAFDGTEGVWFSTERRFLEMHVGGRFILRFKKLDKQLMSRNYRTVAQMNYRAQRPLFDDMGLDAVRLTLGWQMNDVQTEIEKLFVTYPYNDSNVWTLSIPEPAVSMAVPLVPEKAASVPKTKVRSKKAKTEKRDVG